MRSVICAHNHSGRWTMRSSTRSSEPVRRCSTSSRGTAAGLRFEIAAGFPDYKPELPGGQPGGGRSLSAAPFDLNQLGEWRDRITSFPQDWSNVGFDAETRARLHAGADEERRPVRGRHGADRRTAQGTTRRRHNAADQSRAEELIADDGTIVGSGSPATVSSWPWVLVVESSWEPADSNGIPCWSMLFCAARCTAPSHRPTTPATDCAW